MKSGAIFTSKVLFAVLYRLCLFFIQLCDYVFHLIIQYGSVKKNLSPAKKTLGIIKLPSTYKVKTSGIQTDPRQVGRGGS